MNEVLNNKNKVLIVILFRSVIEDCNEKEKTVDFFDRRDNIVVTEDLWVLWERFYGNVNNSLNLRNIEIIE